MTVSRSAASARSRLQRTVVERLLAAATRAPSAHNRKPWRFAVLDTETSKQRLAKAMGERLRTDWAADGDEMTAIDTDVSRSHSRITGRRSSLSCAPTRGSWIIIPTGAGVRPNI
jgi:nitroreductase